MPFGDIDDADDETTEESWRESQWRAGVHATSDGTEVKISHMSTGHLRATIAYFSHLDTAPLENQLKKRGESV